MRLPHGENVPALIDRTLGCRLNSRKTSLPRSWLASWFRGAGSSIATIVLVATLPLATTLAIAQSHETSPKSFFLVASRDMPDPVFQKSVILMLPPDEPPLVAGVIINKPTDVTLDKILKEPVAPANRNQKVYFGGPVELEAPLILIRTTTPPKAAIPLLSDVFAVADPGSISDILKDSRYGSDTRLIVGRAQWLREQLRGELLEGAWSVMPLRTDLIFERDSGKVWPILSQHEHVREVVAPGCGSGEVMTASLCGGTLGPLGFGE